MGCEKLDIRAYELDECCEINFIQIYNASIDSEDKIDLGMTGSLYKGRDGKIRRGPASDNPFYFESTRDSAYRDYFDHITPDDNDTPEIKKQKYFFSDHLTAKNTDNTFYLFNKAHKL